MNTYSSSLQYISKDIKNDASVQVTHIKAHEVAVHPIWLILQPLINYIFVAVFNVKTRSHQSI